MSKDITDEPIPEGYPGAYEAQGWAENAAMFLRRLLPHIDDAFWRCETRKLADELGRHTVEIRFRSPPEPNDYIIQGDAE